MIDTIRLTGIVDEDIVNYKKCSMFLSTATCNWKCCKDCGVPPSTCQNYALKDTFKIIKIKDILDRYLNNDLSEALVIGGLEPLDQFDEVLSLIVEFRKVSSDDIVIYTGYTKDEVISKGYDYLIQSTPDKIVVKYGRYIPNSPSRYDEILGVTLASKNQFAEEYIRSLSSSLNRFTRIIEDITCSSNKNPINIAKSIKVSVELWAELSNKGTVLLRPIDITYLDNIKMRLMSYIPWEDTEIYSNEVLNSLKESLGVKSESEEVIK